MPAYIGNHLRKWAFIYPKEILIMKIYFLVTIDTECDKRRDWSVRYPFEFRNILEAIPDRLQPLFNKHKVKPTFLLSPEIISDKLCVSMFKSLAGDFELGTHLHGEYIEPQSNFFAPSTAEFQADYSYDVELAKLQNLTKLFQNNFGYPPTSFRAGRFGLGPHSLKILEQLGYKVDSSIFPFNRIKTLNQDYNYYYFPVKAYYPDLNDYSRPSPNKTILHIPVTVHNRLFQRLPKALGKPLSKSSFATGLLKKFIGRSSIKTFSLRPSTNSFDQMKEIILAHIGLHDEDEPVFLNMMFHSNELAEGCSPYPQTEDEVRALLARIDELFKFMKNKVNFITMSESFRCMQNV